MMAPTMSGLAAKLSPPDARGRYMSVLSLAQPFGQGIGPALLSTIYDLGNPRMMWICGAGFAGIASLSFFLMDRSVGDSDRLRQG